MSSAFSTSPQVPGRGGGLLLPVYTLAARELVRFFRQRSRLIGALVQPLVFWVLFGAGLRSTTGPQWAEGGYQQYFYPGIAVLVVLFTAIFSTISIIEDRREGFLQGVLAAPVPRLAVVLGKLVGGSLLAVLQAGLFLLVGPALHLVGLAPTIDVVMTPLSALGVLGFLGLLSLALTALGFCIAWPMDSTQGFHAIMSVFLMPMWLLSGAFFPATGSGWLTWVVRVNPLTYGVAGLRRLLNGEVFGAAQPGYPAMWLCLTITVTFGVVCCVMAVWLTGRRASPDRR